MHLPRWLPAALPLAALASAQTCYWPNGNKATAAVACPVANGTEAAACCFKNHYCMSNGMCFSKTELSFYRGACTDSTFEKSGCPKYCDTDDIAGGVPGAHCGIAKCTSSQYACQTTGNCASATFAVPAGTMLLNEFLQSDLAIVDTATATATTATAAATGTTAVTAATTAACSSTAAASSGISTGAAAGIGLGVGAPLAIAIGVLSFMLLREKKKTRAAFSNQVPAGTVPPSPWSKSDATTYVPIEVHGRSAPTELDNNNFHGRHELS